MLVSNACAPDRRVVREASALTEIGFRVKVIAWDREGRHPSAEQVDQVEIERIAVPSAYGSGMRRLSQWPSFARQALASLRREPWYAVHCHDLDTLPIGFAYSRGSESRLVFDAHESYPDLIAPSVPGWAVTAARRMERFLIQRVDALVTVGDLLAEHYRRWARCVVVVRNCQPGMPSAPDPAFLSSLWGLEDAKLVVCYIGGFTRGRLILPLLEAVSADPSLGLLLVGDGPQAPALMGAIGQNPRIAYLGPRVPADQVVSVMQACDVVYYGLRAGFPNNRFSSPNALYAALAAGRPLLTTNVGEISQVVKAEGCGVVLPGGGARDPTATEISLALNQLAEPESRAAMAARARRAGETKYNWENAKRELLDLYGRL
jgi:glycosyltransferase involved in cell wall biosynthesis